MAKPTRKTKAVRNPEPASSPESPLEQFISWTFASGAWVALLLAVITFVVYRPSLTSDFVYDARKEILEEGFVTSLSNLPTVLSLKVLPMDLMLGSRPGQMLYLMLNAAIWDKESFGYHLSSNLLHAANVALLFLLLVRLARSQIPEGLSLKIQVAAAVATLIFALHPIAVESVSEVSYSSSLLVAFFTLISLHAAVSFRVDHLRSAILFGSVATFCALGAVTSKESGIATSLILVACWFLFRRNETTRPWALFLGAPLAVTAAFLTARFMFPPPAATFSTSYVGGSFSHVFLAQPSLWVFMLGKLLWPTNLSADYTVEDIVGLTTPLVMVVLFVVLAMQLWLASKSRMGALGVAVYWLGLVAVSNFVPLLHPLADRYYYLPLAGVSMQLMALLLLALRWGRGFWLAVLPFFLATVPLGLLTISRESVFANNFNLWQDTLRASPSSELAHYGLGLELFQRGQSDEAIAEFNQAIKIDAHDPEAYNGLGIALSLAGRQEEAVAAFEECLRLKPDDKAVQDNLAQAKASLLQSSKTGK